LYLLGFALGCLALGHVFRAVLAHSLLHIRAAEARHRRANHVLLTRVPRQLHALDRQVVGAKLVDTLADLVPLLLHPPNSPRSAPADARASRQQPLPWKYHRSPKRRATLVRPLNRVLRRSQVGSAQRNTLLVCPTRTGPHRGGRVRECSNATVDVVNVDYLSAGGVAPRPAAGLSWSAGRSSATGLPWSAGVSWPAGLPWPTGFPWSAGMPWPAGLSWPAASVSADASAGAPGLSAGTGGGCTVAAGGRHPAGGGCAPPAWRWSAAGGADSPPASDSPMASGGACQPPPSRWLAPEGV